NSLNIPGCQTFAGKNIQNSESELIFPSIDVKGISSKKVLAEIDSKGYFE
ncbi:N-acetylglucosamine-1-phosphate uridyltransferase, partial [Streptococcus canis]